jgi:hypothetical protein
LPEARWRKVRPYIAIETTLQENFAVPIFFEILATHIQMKFIFPITAPLFAFRVAAVVWVRYTFRAGNIRTTYENSRVSS